MRARHALLVAIGFCAWLLAPFNAHAQTWPARPVTVVVPFAAGVTGDIVARGLVEHLSSALGQPFIVDNRAGAGGNVGGAAVAKAAPDGYMLLLATTGPAANNKLMYKNMPYDPQRDFAPIVLMGKSPVIITAKNSLPAKTLKELVDYAKANPGKITAGYPGNGTFGHVTGELLQQSAGMTFVQAQYRGSPAIITDLLGEHIDIGMDFDGALCDADPGEEAARAGDRRCAAVAVVAGRADGRRIRDFRDSRPPCGTRSSRRPARRRRSLRS